MYSDQILSLIEALKTRKNGEWRNKVISHLKDAYAASMVLEREINDNPDFISLVKKIDGANVNNVTPEKATADINCICPVGVRYSGCGATIHKN